MDLGKILDYIPRIGADGLTVQELEDEFGQDLEQWKTVVAEETGIDVEKLQDESHLTSGLRSPDRIRDPGPEPQRQGKNQPVPNWISSKLQQYTC